MSAFHKLEPSLSEILVAIKPLQDDWVARFQIIDELRGVVDSLEVLRGDSCCILMVMVGWNNHLLLIEKPLPINRFSLGLMFCLV